MIHTDFTEVVCINLCNACLFFVFQELKLSKKWKCDAIDKNINRNK